MKTKKLLLGICAFAAVTVPAPHVFGEAAILTGERPVARGTAEAIEMRRQERRRYSTNDERQSAYEEILSLTKQRLNQGTATLADLGLQEVHSVEFALLYERRAYFLREISVHNYLSAYENVKRVQSDLKDAKLHSQDVESRRMNGSLSRFDAFWAKKYADAKVMMLELELADALENKELMFKECVQGVAVVNNYIDMARNLRRSARVIRNCRIDLLTELDDAEIRVRGNGQLDDLKKVSKFINTIDLEKIRVRARQDRAILKHEAKRLANEVKFTAAIRAAICSHTDDGSLDGCMECDDLDFCQELQRRYHQEEIDYDYESLSTQKPRLYSSSFKDTDDLEGKAASALEKRMSFSNDGD
jgi:hypothetical protein